MPLTSPVERLGLMALGLAIAACTTDPAGQHALETGPVAARATAAVTPVIPALFTARGNEPGWRLQVRADTIVYHGDYGATEVMLPRPSPRHGSDTLTYDVEGSLHRLIVDAVPALCRDTMTGMPYPLTVSVTLDGRTLDGCGGEPTEVLTRADPWVVTVVGDQALADGDRPTLAFAQDPASVSGTAGCNRFTGPYSLTGETLRFDGPLATTRRLCAEPVMRVERAFLFALSVTDRFDLTPSGDLLLYAGSDPILRATPPL